MFDKKAVISQWMADLYDLNETDTQDVAFALSLIGAPPRRILEIACGSGRILIPMAKAGHSVTGLDIDEHMLGKIAPKAAGLNNLTWRQADAVADDWGHGFDVVLLAGNFLFNIVSDVDYEGAQRLLIQKAAGALALDGHLYIDYGYTAHPESWFHNPGEHVIWEGTDSRGTRGRMLLAHSSFDRQSGMNRFIRKFELTLADGRTVYEQIPSQKHFATLAQIHHWLFDAGFAIEKEYGDYDCNPIDEKTRRAILWARNMRAQPPPVHS